MLARAPLSRCFRPSWLSHIPHHPHPRISSASTVASALPRVKKPPSTRPQLACLDAPRPPAVGQRAASSSAGELSSLAMASPGEVISAQFQGIDAHLEEVNSVRERLREVVSRMDGTTRAMHSELLAIHGAGSAASDAVKAAVDKCKERIPELQGQYAELARIMEDRPREYYKFNDHWKGQSSTVSFLLTFMHWLETGELLSHAQVEANLGLNHEKFGLDLEDYLIGVCSLSSELPRFVINRVTIGDYECPRRVACFLNDLFAAFRKLNLRNDLLRKRFDGIKYDLKKVEEVLYDVEIRGLGSKDAATS